MMASLVARERAAWPHPLDSGLQSAHVFQPSLGISYLADAAKFFDLEGRGGPSGASWSRGVFAPLGIGFAVFLQNKFSGGNTKVIWLYTLLL